jgi:putative NIF3 family GTP cyclohydrolase 1 type 2
MTVKEFIDKLLLETLPGYSPDGTGEPIRTCDGLLYGDPEKEVKKVASTFMVTVEVIRKAMADGIDLIITHEPLMCVPSQFGPMRLMRTAVDEEKFELLKESGIAIMRYHDGMHATRPDLIYRGWMEEFGWAEYNQPGPNNHFFIIPETTLGEVAELMKTKLGINGIRAFGDASTPVSRVGVLVGGGSQGLGNPMMPMQFCLDDELDLLICGEIMELMLPYFAADAAALGHKCTMLILGHNRSEEPGMKYLHLYLQDLMPEVEYSFLEAGDPFYII